MIQKGFSTRNSVLTKLFLSDDRFNVHKSPSIFWFYHPSAVSAADIRKAVLLTASVIVAITTASHLWGWLPGSRTRSLVLQILMIFRIASRPTQLQKRTSISSLNSKFHILYLNWNPLLQGSFTNAVFSFPTIASGDRVKWSLNKSIQASATSRTQSSIHCLILKS